MQLIVLGMHRSGTSALSRILNLMGAYFGPEGIGTGANQENPKGFWERRDVRSLNDSVLHAVGCDWDQPLKLDLDALPKAVEDDFMKRASQLVLEMDANRPWFMKEPRLCLLLPLWLRVLEVPVCLHICRHPVEVASSMYKRNGIPMPVGLALWEKYVRSGLSASAHLPRLVISHRQLVTEPVPTTERLFQRLQAEKVSGLRMPSEREIASFISGDLYREREDRDDLRKYAKAPQVGMFNDFVAGKLFSRRVSSSLSEEATKALAGYEASRPPVLPKEVKKVLGPADIALREKIAAREQEARMLREQVTKLDTKVRERDERLTGISEERGKLRADLAASRAELRARNQERGKIVEELSRQSQQLKQLHALKRDAEQSVDVRFQEIAKLTRLLMDRELELERVRRKQFSISAELEIARRELATIHGSKSWKLSAPLRRTAVLLRAVRGSRRSSMTEDAKLVEQSGLFDSKWYLETYPDVARRGIDAIEHYLRFGMAEGRNPGPGFDSKAYLRDRPDVAKAGMNPLVHYIRHGKQKIGGTGNESV